MSEREDIQPPGCSDDTDRGAWREKNQINDQTFRTTSNLDIPSWLFLRRSPRIGPFSRYLSDSFADPRSSHVRKPFAKTPPPRHRESSLAETDEAHGRGMSPDEKVSEEETAPRSSQGGLRQEGERGKERWAKVRLSDLSVVNSESCVMSTQPETTRTKKRRNEATIVSWNAVAWPDPPTDPASLNRENSHVSQPTSTAN